MTKKQQEPLPTINARAGGDQAASGAHTDNVVRATPDTDHEPANNAAFTDNNDIVTTPGQPPLDPRQDTLTSSGDAETRRNMQHPYGMQGEASFTKGDNAPSFNQLNHQGMTTEIDDGPSSGADVPGGSGATPLSQDRDAFINDVMQTGHFADKQEATMWTRAVFNVLRRHALESDKTVATALQGVIRVGESPEVQVEEMMWGGDYVGRLQTLIEAARNIKKQDFYREVADQAGSDAGDPWVEDAVYSYFSALKKRASNINAGELGELREVWERTQ